MSMIPSEIVLTIIISVPALVISLLSLWFSHLKGPDIDLCDVPETELNDWSKQELDQSSLSGYVPYGLGLKPMQLVFMNSGNRAGAVIQVTPKFEPNAKFETFYRDEWGSVEVNGKGLPTSIKEGDTCIMKLSYRIDVIDWRQDFRNDEIHDISNFKEAFTKSVELDKSHFSEFVNFLRSGESLGNLRISMTHSARKWSGVRTTTREIAKVEVKNRCKNLPEGLKKKLEMWDSASAVNELLRRIPEVPDQLIEKLKENLDRVSRELKRGSFHMLDDLGDYWRRLYEQRRVASRIVFEREKDLKSQLDELSQEIRAYNSELYLVSAAREDVRSERIETLNQKRQKLQPKIKEALSKVEDLRKKLIDEVQ